MRKITMLNRVSIDGYFASSNEAAFGMDWFIPDPEVDQAVRSGDGVVDTLLLGAVTYLGFERSWVPMLNDPNTPAELRAVAERLTGLNKIVYSTRLKETTWANTELYDGNIAEKVRRLKEDEGGDILIMGSGTIVRQLANERLIDEFKFIVTPVVAGEGKPLFRDVLQFGLSLVEARSFSSGNVLLHYELKK